MNAGNGTFAAPIDVPLGAGSSPHTPVAGDLDGDGDPDLAVSLKNLDSVQLVINTAGVFAPGATFTVGDEPRDLEIGDLDRDGDLDLVAANREGDSLSVLRNGGALTFAVATFPAGLEPRELSIRDFTTEGLLDIAVAAHDSDAALVFQNVDNATFTLAASLSPSSESPEGLTTARMDGDGLFDVVVTASSGGQELVFVFRKRHAGFAPLISFPTGGLDSGSIAAGDFDLDGDQDVATANAGSSDVSLLQNAGDGTLPAPQLVAVGTHPGHILAADLDGNGSTDLVTTNETSGDVTVMLNAVVGTGPMASICHPGEGRTIDCPCGNPPGSSGRGCNNSSNTGGAQLTASGNPFLTNDTLVFATSGEKPSALSLLVQANFEVPDGIVFGQGVRCGHGLQKRLFFKAAVGGSITAPGAGDPPISTVAAQRGDPISPGQERVYYVYYRDPIVLGGCTYAATFNATQGGRILWMP